MLTICDDAVAQTSRTISGTVEDARKEPIIGATIRIDGIPSGTMTDHDGKFKLKLPANKNCTLIVSCFGYETLKKEITGDTPDVAIVLKETHTDIDEVVVIGYGTAKKSELTSSVETISAKDLAKIPAMNIDQSLGGQVAGLGVKAVSGDPSLARESTMSIRGNLGDPLLVLSLIHI